MGGSYKDLELDAERAIDMGTRVTLKIHKRGEGAVKTGKHVFVLKVGTDEGMMEFLNRYSWGRSSSSTSG